MASDITPERIKELWELCETLRGPWTVDHDAVVNDLGIPVAVCPSKGPAEEIILCFIAAARQAIPDLLDALEEAQRWIERAKLLERTTP